MVLADGKGSWLVGSARLLTELAIEYSSTIYLLKKYLIQKTNKNLFVFLSVVSSIIIFSRDVSSCLLPADATQQLRCCIQQGEKIRERNKKREEIQPTPHIIGCLTKVIIS